MIIDMHVHPMLYQEISVSGDAPEGFDFWSREFGMGHMGTMAWDEIKVEFDVCGIDRSVLLPLDVTSTSGGHFATNQQVADLVAAHPGAFWNFASVDPANKDAPADLERAFTELGALGLCLNPAKQQFDPSDTRARPLYELCERYDKPVMFHAGLSWEPGAPLSRSHPLAFERTIMDYPHVRFCLAHFAWPWVRELVAMLLKYPNLYTDTSVTYIDSPEEMMSRLFTADMGPLWYERGLSHQVMFGSNTPRFRAFKLIRALDQVPMRDDARERLYAGTALEFLRKKGE